jgi:hypothetical protein
MEKRWRNTEENERNGRTAERKEEGKVKGRGKTERTPSFDMP